MTDITESVLKLQFFASIALETEWPIRGLIDCLIADQVPEHFVQQVRLIRERLAEIRVKTGPYQTEKLRSLDEQANIARLNEGFSQFEVAVKDLVVSVDNLTSNFTLAHFQDIQNKIETIKQLLENAVTQLNQLGQRKEMLDLETFDVVSVIRQAVEMVERRFFTETTTNKLIVSCTDTLGTIHADRTRLHQILLNQLMRAAKSAQNGTIMLSATREKTDNGDWVILQVDDTGQGIPADQLQQIEQSIVPHALSSLPHDIRDARLGLLITARLCQVMGGEFTITSEWGKGSHVRMRIPAIVSQPQEDAIGRE